MRMPVFPLPMAISPGEQAPLHIFEPRYKQLIEEAQDEGITFGIPPVLDGRIARFGTETRLVHVVSRMADGKMDILVEGVRPIEIVQLASRLTGKLYGGAEVHLLEDDDDEPDPTLRDELLREFGLHQRLLKRKIPIIGEGSGLLSWTLSPHVALPLGNRVEILSIVSEPQRQQYVLTHLRRVNASLRARKDAKSASYDPDRILNAGNRLN